MRFGFKKPLTIHGIDVPRRRFTLWAGVYFVAFFCLPVLLIGLIFDAAMYFLFRGLFDSCYAFLCFFQ